MFGIGIGSVAESMLYAEVEKLGDSVSHWRKVADHERGKDKDELLTEINNLRQKVSELEKRVDAGEKGMMELEKDMMKFQRELLKLLRSSCL